MNLCAVIGHRPLDDTFQLTSSHFPRYFPELCYSIHSASISGVHGFSFYTERVFRMSLLARAQPTLQSSVVGLSSRTFFSSHFRNVHTERLLMA